jgi:hypothetical protein
MRKLELIMVGLAMAGATACGGNEKANTLATDTALSRDLSLATQMRPYPGLDSMSAFETTPFAQPAAEAPVVAPAPTPVRRTASSAATRTRSTPSSTRRRSSSSRTSTASTGDVDVGTRSEGRVVVERNTRRDAAIGAAAGAVIGAATSRNKVKGAVIGAAAGGVLGGIIGHTVDVKKRRVP